MPDEIQTENLQTGSPEQIDATGSGVPTPPPSDGDTADGTDATAPATATAPAATVRAYHDIIAERLARKNPAAAARPMAHASDVENTPKPAPLSESPVAQAETSATSSTALPAEIEQGTKSQEIQAEGPKEEKLSGSRERARLRQQERAEL